MKHELLVPAGNMECLRQAVFNGCDAVYLACKNFGARKFANNFTNEEILEAIRFCHLYGVRIYVTMNTLVKNNEVEDFINQARFLHKNGVDALIVQDFGMICLLREKFPNLEIHASTQANISSKDVCKLYYDLGVKRVVFSRELSIDEIDSIDVPIEKEAFIHGALCISYSGCCLMSSMLGGRSGNRGECAGCCRMPFSLEKNGKTIKNSQYLLSTKELNTSSYISRLLKSSILSFKIEGRMKSPLYVGFITNFYRRLIDGVEIDYDEEIDHLKTIFNREFTIGRMFNASDIELMNPKSPNHIGLEIGRVVEIKNHKVKIELKKGYSLHQYDAIRFLNQEDGFVVNYLYDKNLKLVNSVSNICYVDDKTNLQINDVVVKTHDYLLEEYYKNKEEKRIPVSYKVSAHLGEKLIVTMSDSINNVSLEGNVVSQALSSPITCESIEKQLSKLGNTPFICSDCDIDAHSNIFISVGELNDIRRKLVEEITKLREKSPTTFLENDIYSPSSVSSFDGELEKVSCFVNDKEQLVECLNDNVSCVYVNSNLYYDDPSLVLAIPRCSYDIKSKLVSLNLVSDYAHYEDNYVIGNYTLNVMNVYTAYYLNKIGVSRVCLSVELSEDELLEFMDLYSKKFGKSNFEVLVYGRVHNMIIKGNILNLEKDVYDYYLVDHKLRKFPVYYDGSFTHILNHEHKKLDVSLFKDKCCLRYDFYEESSTCVKQILNQ